MNTVPVVEGVDQLLALVPWQACAPVDTSDGEPYATHSGELHVMGVRIRCYRLNNGQTVVHGDDMQLLLTALLVDDIKVAARMPPTA